MQPEYEDVISSFYEAALDRSQWRVGMHKLAQLADAQAALSLRASVDDPGAGLVENVGHPEEAMAQYVAYYNRLDPMYSVARFTRVGEWLNDWKLVGPGMARTEWYNDFCRRYETHAVLSNLVVNDGGQVAAISVQRFIGQPVFSDVDEERLAPVVPHLRRAAQLFFGVERLREHETLARAVLDTLHLAVWVLEADGKVLLCNRLAEQALLAGGGLRLRFGRLEGAWTDGRWSKALRAATDPLRPRGACLLLPGAHASGSPLLVAPCSTGSAWGTTFQRPVAVAVLAGRSAHAPAVDQMLGTLYGLTPAEARVACAIADGLAPSEVAQQLHTSVQTTRTQLKAVFSKAGVRRQSELSRLVAGLRIVGGQ